MDVFVIYLLHSRRRRHRDNQQVADPLQAHGQIIIKDENYRKSFYEGFPPEPEDPRLPRALGPNGENVYASSQLCGGAWEWAIYWKIFWFHMIFIWDFV